MVSNFTTINDASVNDYVNVNFAAISTVLVNECIILKGISNALAKEYVDFAELTMLRSIRKPRAAQSCQELPGASRS